MNNSQKESPEEHYHSSGAVLIAIDSVIMCVASIMLLLENHQSNYDHVSNILMGLMILGTGIWLRAHNAEDMV